MAVNATTDDGPITREKREFVALLLLTTRKIAGLKELTHGCSQLRYQMAVNSYDRVMFVDTYPCPGIILTMS